MASTSQCVIILPLALVDEPRPLWKLCDGDQFTLHRQWQMLLVFTHSPGSYYRCLKVKKARGCETYDTVLPRCISSHSPEAGLPLLCTLLSPIFILTLLPNFHTLFLILVKLFSPFSSPLFSFRLLPLIVFNLRLVLFFYLCFQLNQWSFTCTK